MVDFSIYTEIAKWIGWPAVSALLVLLIAVIIYFYNEYSKILKEKNIQLQNEIESFKTYSFDQLLIRLQERHKAAMEEMDRLIKEKELKDKELEDVKSERDMYVGHSQVISEKVERLSKEVEIFKIESEKAKVLAKRKEIEVTAIMKQSFQMAEDYKNKLASLSKE